MNQMNWRKLSLLNKTLDTIFKRSEGPLGWCHIQAEIMHFYTVMCYDISTKQTDKLDYYDNNYESCFCCNNNCTVYSNFAYLMTESSKRP